MRFVGICRLAALSLLVSLCPMLDAPTALASMSVEAAPGRVVFQVDGGRAVLSAAVAMPRDGALVAGAAHGSGDVYLAKVTSTGTLDPSFGNGGVLDVAAQLSFEQILLTPDGHILLVGMHSPRGHFEELQRGDEHGSLVVVRLNADGSLDRGYGNDGTAQTTIEGGCFCKRIAVLEADGTLVLTGQRRVTVHRKWGSVVSSRWTLARLTSAGVLDPSFGSGGVSVLEGEEGVGLSIEPAPGGTLIAQGQQQVTKEGSSGPENLITRITAQGAVDPGYAGGKPFGLPVFSLDDSYGQVPDPLEALTEPDGTVLVETFPVPANPGHPKKDYGPGLVAYDTGGRPEQSFGYGGYLNLEEGREPMGSLLFRQPDGSILAVHRRAGRDPDYNQQAVPGLLEFQRIEPEGRIDLSFATPPGLTVRVPFGGGDGVPLPGSRYTFPETLLTLDQDEFLGAQVSPLVVPLADGSTLLAGNVALTEPRAGRAAPVTRSSFALALLTPRLQLDISAGGPARTASLTIASSFTSTGRAVSRAGLTVTVNASAPGLVKVEAFAGGRLVAHRLAAVLHAGSSSVTVPLNRRTRRLLKAHPRQTLRVVGAFRDLLATEATGATATIHLH